MAEVGSGNRHPVARFGAEVRGGQIFFATAGLGSPAPLRGDPRTTARRASLAEMKADRVSRLQLPRSRH